MTASSPSVSDEPRLSPDFAARVMHRAEEVRARRRFVRRLAGVSAILLAAVLVPAIRSAITPEPPKQTAAVTRRTPVDLSSRWLASPRQEASALGYLFPNAAPLRGFVNRYSAVTYGISVDDESDPVEELDPALAIGEGDL